MTGKSKLQRQIISEHKKNNEQRDEEIAVKLDCSSSYVNSTRNTYENEQSSDTPILFWIIGGAFILLALAEAGLL